MAGAALLLLGVVAMQMQLVVDALFCLFCASKPSCTEFSRGKDFCWKDPPTEEGRWFKDTLRSRSSYAPKFVLGTVFHVVDGEAHTKWVHTIKTQSRSMGNEVAKVLINQQLSYSPWGNALAFGLNSMAALGIDPFNSGDQPPIELDLTNMFNKLKGNVLEQVDETLFKENLDELNGYYRSYKETVEVIQRSRDYQNILTKIAPIYQDLSTSFQTNIAMSEEWTSKYGFFMIEPLYAHGMLHYAVAMLRTAAQLSLHEQFGEERPHLLHDACVDIEDFNNKWSEYKEWWWKMLRAGIYARAASVPHEPTCDSKCDAEHTGGTSSYRWGASYTWRDEWKVLEMPLHEEGWEIQGQKFGRFKRKINRRTGVNTVGADLRQEIADYREEMNSVLTEWWVPMFLSGSIIGYDLDKLVDGPVCSEFKKEKERAAILRGARLAAARLVIGSANSISSGKAVGKDIGKAAGKGRITKLFR